MALDGLTAIIEGAVSDARGEDVLPEADSGDTGDDATDAGTGGAAEADADAGDGETVVEGEGDGETKVVDGEDATVVEEKKPEEKLVEDKDSELGPAKDAKGRENKIPHSRVVKITDNAVKKALAPIAAAMGLTAETYKPEAVVARLNEAKDLQTKLDQNKGLERLIDANPDQFVTLLASHHPGYKKFAAVLDGKAAPATAAATVVPTEEPGPDIEIKNDKGEVTGKTYSLAGLKKRDEWRDAQLEARITAKFTDQFKPLTDRQARIELEAKVEPVLQAQITEAKTWKDWATVEKDVEAVLVADGAQAKQTGRYQHSLRSAYLQVMNTRLEKLALEANTKAEKASVEARKKVLADLKKAPRSTAVPAAGGRSAEDVGPRNIADIIREQVAGLK